MKLKFSPVNLPYVNWIIRPAKEPRREKGEVFLPYTINKKVFLK